jgi:hypothetical protein
MVHPGDLPSAHGTKALAVYLEIFPEREHPAKLEESM